MTITPLKSRVEAIAKLPPPRTTKQCKSFCGVVNYVGMFCPNLQQYLKPLYEANKEGNAISLDPPPSEKL